MKNYFNDKEILKQVFIFACAGIIVVSFYLLIANLPVLKSIFDTIISVMMPFIWGIIFYLLLVNISNYIEDHLPKKFKYSTKRKISVLLTMLFFFFIIFMFFAILVPSLVSSITQFYNNIRLYIVDLISWLDSLSLDSIFMYEIDDISQNLVTYVEKVFETIKDNMPQIFSVSYSAISGIAAFINNFISFAIGIIICIYILLDRDNIHRQFKKLGNAFLRKDNVYFINHVIVTAIEKFNRFIRGQLIDALVVGIICFVSMTVLRLDYAVLISFICAVTNVIPVFGPFIGAIPSAFILLMVDPMQCLIFMIMILVIQQIDGNIICPYILGDSIGLSKIWIMFAIIVGGGLFGIVGMFLGVPIFGLIYHFLTEIANNRIKEKNLIENEKSEG